jgi:hypothetical protein
MYDGVQLVEIGSRRKPEVHELPKQIGGSFAPAIPTCSSPALPPLHRHDEQFDPKPSRGRPEIMPGYPSRRE